MAKRQWVKVVLLGMVILAGGLLIQAEEWTIYGPRAQGMGGAGVAVGDEATAFYWNPAALALNKKTVSLHIPFGLTIGAEGDIIKKADAVAKTIAGFTTSWEKLSNKMETGQPLDPNEVQDLLDLYINKIPNMDEEGQGLLFNGGGGLSLTIKNIGIFANVGGSGAADPVVDLQIMNLGTSTTNTAQIQNVIGTGPYPGRYGAGTTGDNLADEIGAANWGWTQLQAEELVWQAEQAGAPIADPSVQQMIKNIAQATGTVGATSAVQNQSGIIISGLFLKEVGVSYGRSLMGEKLYIGGSLKFMDGETFYNFIKYDMIEGGGDISDDLTDKKNTKKSTAFGLDLGLLWKPTKTIKVGITGRNLNRPKFKFTSAAPDSYYKLDPQIRLGGAFNLGKTLVLGIDADVTTNESPALDDYDSRMVGAGLEFRIPIIAISGRAGGYKNMASDEASLVYTLGVGLHLIFLDLDLAGAMSTNKVKIESGSGGEEISDRYSISVSLSLKF